MDYYGFYIPIIVLDIAVQLWRLGTRVHTYMPFQFSIKTL